jgi:hypothetical protein
MGVAAPPPRAQQQQHAPRPGGGWLWTATAATLLALTALRLRGATAWLQGLLSVSDRFPPPPGVAADVAVVLGYALHRNGSCTRPLQSRVEVGVALFREVRRRPGCVDGGTAGF